MRETITKWIRHVKETQPLIHNITNQVVMNFTANGLYALGALPVMAHSKREVAEVTSHADALVLNLGTLTESALESMIIAGKAANQKGIPVVLDPIAVGTTEFRRQSARRILSEVELSLVCGNAGEISYLAGLKPMMRGVDTTGQIDNLNVVQEFVERFDIPLLMTGKEDYVADQKEIIRIKNGTSLLTKVTGTGCLLSAVAGAFLAVSESDLHAVVAAISYYTIAAEKAAEKTTYPGQFQIAFLDALDYTSADDVTKGLKLDIVKGGAQ